MSIIICFLYSAFLSLSWFVLGDYFISLVLTMEYMIISKWIYLLMVFLLIRNIGYVVNWRLIGESKFKIIAKYNSISLVLSILSSTALIYYFDFQGAHYSLGVTSLIYLLCMAYAFKIKDS